MEWPTDWQGSHLVNNIALQAIYLQPTVAYRLADGLSVGFGPNLVSGEVEFNRNLSTSLANSDGDRANVTISDSGVTSWGYNLGLHAQINESLALGISYRSEVTLEARGGDADFENLPTSLAANFPDGDFDADLVLRQGRPAASERFRVVLVGNRYAFYLIAVNLCIRTCVLKSV